MDSNLAVSKHVSDYVVKDALNESGGIIMSGSGAFMGN